MPLQYQTSVPDGAEDGALTFVLLHGRGSDMHDLLGLRRGLPDDAVIVTPQAPFPGEAWGYGGGWAWYRYIGDGRPEPDSFETSQRHLHEFLGELASILPLKPGPLVLGGFSQGGTMSTAYALRNPGSVRHVINFSGFLPIHPSVTATPETVRGTRFFWGHGTHDPSIPLEMAETGRTALRHAGADLLARDYRMGHWIEAEELEDVVRWLREGLDGTDRSMGATP